ncbi:hypothetical protein JIG36_47750 [Actinoplanes sp. LDG1-06]|uniref:FtsK domain-containing protein n=1 Tax=Paractinoplanes ovalisporus TaxID=2810368 RepID=A0ABS2ATM9_9ACTN|nr:FtsK/SpoIIIE domain-containing protein [Actinoplanes ovalisporus]MBM2623217.1 hypothetical protein [Actinoplanes ovalisporus]
MTDLEPVHRRARRLGALPEVTAFEVPAPPTVEQPRPPQAALVFLPVLTTGTILIFGILSGRPQMIVLGVLVTLGAMATPLIMYRGSSRSAARRNMARAERYTAMLDAVDCEVRAAQGQIRAALEFSHPTAGRMTDWIGDGRLWERRLTDDDFLDVAVGVADVPSGVTVAVGKVTALDADIMGDLQERAAKTGKAARTVRDAPFAVSLTNHPVLGIEGPRDAAAGLARSILLEALVCCGPDELSLLVAAPPELEHEWDWTITLPHMAHQADPGGGRPRIATDAKTLAASLARLVEPRAQLLDEIDWSTVRAGLAHVVVVLDGYRPLSDLHGVPQLRDVLAGAGKLGLTVLTVAAAARDSPAEASAVLVVDGRGQGVLQPVRSTASRTRFAAVGADCGTAQRVSEIISRRRLVSDLSFAGDPAGDMLLDLLGQRPVRPRWGRRDPAAFLTATVGVEADGRPFTLDLKESAAGGDGPHGLLVGATGSGKSELLRSLITSLALTHRPDELQIAFVDFKGGAAFELLAELPHAAGLITNILDDPTLIARMRSSLSGELLARQRLLAGHGRDLQSIGDYRELRDRDPSLPAMPYLLLVIDEFAELLETDPGFLDLLLSVGRQGRSLGVHLLLAGQRLEAGRIRGLESYLSYRIALRTFTPEESIATIGSKVAAELPPLPGHGFHRAAGTLRRFKGSRVSFAADLGLVVERLRDVPPVPPLWLPPLPDPGRAEILALDDPRLDHPAVPVGDGLPFVVGLLDDPSRRRQDPVVVDVAQRGGHLAVVGAPQTGKSSAMATELVQAARRFPAFLLRFYVLDFGGGRLAAAAGLPNVGAYATPQEPQRVGRILAEISTLLDDRAVRFRRDHVTGMPAQRRLAEQTADEETQAHTVLMIDNYAAFKERYPGHEAVIERLLIEGASFGLHLHLTTARWTDVSTRKLEQIGVRFELRLNEATDSMLGRARGAALTSAGPGRALGSDGRQLQIAAPCLGAESPSPGDLADVVAAITDASSTEPAQSLRLLDDLTADEFRAAGETVAAGGILVGVHESGFRPVPFRPGRDGHLLIYGDAESGRTATLARMLAGADAYVVDFRGRLSGACGTARSIGELTEMVGVLHGLLAARMADGLRTGDRPLLVVVDDYELVQAMSPPGLPGTLADLSAYALAAEQVGAAFVVNQTATNALSRIHDPLIRRMLEASAWRLHFSVAARTEPLPGNLRGRPLAPGVAQLIRPGRPDALIGTLGPPSPDEPTDPPGEGGL